MTIDPDLKISSAFVQGTCLSELDASSLEAVTKAAFRRTYKKNEIVCLEGEPCSGLMIVESGWIKAVKISPQGREQETRLAGPGDMVNEISLMAGENNLVTLKSLESSLLWVIERDTLFRLMAEHPLLSQLMSKNLAQQVVHLLDLVEDLALRNVNERLARLLLERSQNDIIHRQNWSTQAEMAARIGTTPVIVSRTLGKMENDGAIRLDRQKITILDRKKLESAETLRYK
jgi:CRP-like cAMP-binding protein